MYFIKLTWWAYTYTYHFQIGEKGACLVTGFNNHPRVQGRERSWQILLRLSHGYNLPWLCGWDFNEILYSHEEKGLQDRGALQMTRFLEALEVAGFRDLGYEGLDFTCIMVEKRKRRFWKGWTSV